MELFKITCVTCKARLSVRNRDLIGQIIACPRCESMVQVQAPSSSVTAHSPPEVESIPQEPVVPSNFDASIPEAAPEHIEPLASDAAPLHDSIALAKYKLAAWTLASFAVGAVLGAVYYYSSNNSTGTISSAVDTVAKEEVDVDTSREDPASLSPQPNNNSHDSTETVLSQQDELFAEVGAIAAPVAIDQQQAAPQESAESTAENEVKVEAEPAVQNSPRRRFDPLELDPESLDLAELAKAGQEAKGTETSTTDNTGGTESGQQSLQPTTAPSVRRDPQQADSEPPKSAQEQLAQPLPALKVKEMPIVDFLSLISRLGGVPVSVAPDQLQMAGITARRSVSVDVEGMSIAEAFWHVLEPVRLEHTTDGSQVVVIRQEATKLREIEYPLDDLANSSTSVDDIAGWVKRFVLPTVQPSTIEVVGTTLKIEQPEELQYQVLIFLERVRLARKLQARSRFPVERLAVAPAYASLAERLNAPTTFTFSQYTPVFELVHFWQREIDIPILVDWPALAELDLWPNSRIACAVENQPWSLALDTVLEPLGLGWRAVPGDSIQITLAEKVETELQLELLPLNEKLSVDAERILQQANRIAEKQSSQTPQPTAHAIEYDPTGNVLIVLGPATVQRNLYEWLRAENVLPGKND